MNDFFEIMNYVLVAISAILGIWATISTRGKTWLNKYNQLKTQIEKYMVDAEGLFTEGEEKKKYVIRLALTFAQDIGIHVDEQAIGDIIESIILITKGINNKK